MRRRALLPAPLLPSLAPAQPRPPLVARLADALRVLVNDPDLRARFDEHGMDAQFQTGPELAAMLDTELRLRCGLILDADIRAE